MTTPRDQSAIDAALLDGLAEGGIRHGAVHTILDSILENLDTSHGVSSEQLLGTLRQAAHTEQQTAFDYLRNQLGSENRLVSALAVDLLRSDAPLAGGLGRDARRAVLAAALTVPAAAAHVISLAQDDDQDVRQEAQAIAAARLIAGDSQIQAKLDELRASEDLGQRSLYFEILATARGSAPTVGAEERTASSSDSTDSASNDLETEMPRTNLGLTLSQTTIHSLIQVKVDLHELRDEILDIIESEELVESHAEWLRMIRDLLAEMLVDVESAIETRHWPASLPGLTRALNTTHKALESHPATTQVSATLAQILTAVAIALVTAGG